MNTVEINYIQRHSLITLSSVLILSNRSMFSLRKKIFSQRKNNQLFPILRPMDFCSENTWNFHFFSSATSLMIKHDQIQPSVRKMLPMLTLYIPSNYYTADIKLFSCQYSNCLYNSSLNVRSKIHARKRVSLW